MHYNYYTVNGSETEWEISPVHFDWHYFLLSSFTVCVDWMDIQEIEKNMMQKSSYEFAELFCFCWFDMQEYYKITLSFREFLS